MQENAVSASPIEQDGPSVPSEPTLTFPPIAGFWRRFFAWLVDAIIVGVIAQIIGITFSSFFLSIGPYGRPIGLLFILPYFGIMNSRIGSGQTLGKRWMKIAVRNKNNEPIELWRSLVRSLVVGSPAIFNSWTIAVLLLALTALLFRGWAIPTAQDYVGTWFESLLVFGLGGAILYTMVFNFKPRQGIHDLFFGTYVVHLSGKPTASFPTTSRIHWVVTSAWIGIVAIGAFAIISILMVTKPTLAAGKGPINILQEDPRFFTASVNYDFETCCGKTTSSLNITVWYKGKIGEGERQEVADSIVKTVLDNEKDINNFDQIKVNITSAYELGIASGHSTFSIDHSVEGWRKEIYPNGASGFIP